MTSPSDDTSTTAPEGEAAAELADLRGVRPPAIGDSKDAQDLLYEAEARGDIDSD